LHNDRSVSVEEGKALAREMKAIFLETSAKENQGVADIFTRVVTAIETDDDQPTKDKEKCVIS